ncbi:hypothetical protein SISNIDRAFT_471693 [Sistotremastrum niveocremeum HHB9708]|uniref:Uncharacterized protein n=1 Tax=Sistotremastrum niveocremeum HHB9708 TaxID=1314777 RepID=A0A164MBD4_9AGAM|nr:hypothetical protein SISNIDRAFT_471693 [Sistotremastrum niveocremeum HHB9708]
MSPASAQPASNLSAFSASELHGVGIGNADDRSHKPSITYPYTQSLSYPSDPRTIDQPPFAQIPAMRSSESASGFPSSFAVGGVCNGFQNDQYRIHANNMGGQLPGRQPAFWQVPPAVGLNYMSAPRGVNTDVYSLNHAAQEHTSFTQAAVVQAVIRNSNGTVFEPTQHHLVNASLGEGVFTILQSNSPGTNLFVSPVNSSLQCVPKASVRSFPSITPVQWQGMTGSSNSEAQVLFTTVPSTTVPMSGTVYTMPTVVQPVVQPHQLISYQYV